MDTTTGALQPPAAPLPAELRELLGASDADSFEQALDALIRRREHALFHALGKLARELHEAVKHLASDVESGGLAAQALPEARRRLGEAMSMSEQAAHASLDVTERLMPEAARLEEAASTLMMRCDGLAGDPLADDAGTLARQAAIFADACREGLREMTVAQSWQDLTGQRMQQIAAFMERAEHVLLELVQLAGTLAGTPPAPAVPTSGATASTQDQVDRLLAEFGF